MKGTSLVEASSWDKPSWREMGYGRERRWVEWWMNYTSEGVFSFMRGEGCLCHQFIDFSSLSFLLCSKFVACNLLCMVSPFLGQQVSKEIARWVRDFCDSQVENCNPEWNLSHQLPEAISSSFSDWHNLGLHEYLLKKSFPTANGRIKSYSHFNLVVPEKSENNCTPMEC